MRLRLRRQITIRKPTRAKAQYGLLVAHRITTTASLALTIHRLKATTSVHRTFPTASRLLDRQRVIALGRLIGTVIDHLHIRSQRSSVLRVRDEPKLIFCSGLGVRKGLGLRLHFDTWQDDDLSCGDSSVWRKSFFFGNFLPCTFERPLPYGLTTQSGFCWTTGPSTPLVTRAVHALASGNGVLGKLQKQISFFSCTLPHPILHFRVPGFHGSGARPSTRREPRPIPGDGAPMHRRQYNK
jgi:hypothetical protein